MKYNFIHALSIMPQIIRTLTLLSLFVATQSALIGKEESITRVFSIFVWPLENALPGETFSEKWSYHNGEEIDTINIIDGSRSKQFVHEGSSNVTLFQGIPGPDGTTIESPRAQFQFPNSASQVFVMLFPQSKLENGLYRTTVFDISPGSLPSGHVRLVNASSQEIVGQILGKNVSFTPGQSKLFRLTTDKIGRARFYGQIAAIEDGKPEIVDTFVESLNPNESYLFLVFNVTRGGRAHWKSISFGNMSPKPTKPLTTAID